MRRSFIIITLMDVKKIACVASSVMEFKRRSREGFWKLHKFAAPLLLFSSSVLDTANKASYENTGDQVAIALIRIKYLD